MAMAAFGYRIEPLSEMAANAREVAQRSTFAIPAITPGYKAHGKGEVGGDL